MGIPPPLDWGLYSSQLSRTPIAFAFDLHDLAFTDFPSQCGLVLCVQLCQIDHVSQVYYLNQ
jgi:hypothetical protein